MKEKKRKQNVVKLRQKQVRKLYFKSFLTQEQVANKLGVSEKTIGRDIKEIRKSLGKELSKDNVTDFMNELLADAVEDIKRASRQFIISEGRDKASFLSVKNRVRKDVADLFIRLGYVDHVAQKFEVDLADTLVKEVIEEYKKLGDSK